MSKVYEHYQEENGKSYRRACGRMPKDSQKGRKKKVETQIEGQMELVPDKHNNLVVVLPSDERTRATQKKWNKEARKYYQTLNNMVDSYGAYIQMLRPWQDLKKNGLDKASSGSRGLLSDYFKDDFGKMTAIVYKRKDELFTAIKAFSKEAARFKIDYPVKIEEDLGNTNVRQKYRKYINTKIAALDREMNVLEDTNLVFVPEKAITKVLTPSDLRTKYLYHKRKDK
ncbi:hypothetical protein IKW75_03450 [Candidatus Saccharibacteria bacterium]|nr:hypothetical protein [Candidatus Saccharibacteria bacterium]